MRAFSALTLLFLAACGPAAVTDAVDDTDETDVVETDETDLAENVWYIDDEEHPGLYASLNCEMNDELLRLSASDDGGVGSIQIILGERPTADVTLTVEPLIAELAPGKIYVAIGRDRESDNQYVAQSGSVSVTVVTTDPQEINLSFTDLPATTDAAATADLSGEVGARAGSFVGACDFADLDE